MIANFYTILAQYHSWGVMWRYQINAPSKIIYSLATVFYSTSSYCVGSAKYVRSHGNYTSTAVIPSLLCHMSGPLWLAHPATTHPPTHPPTTHPVQPVLRPCREHRWSASASSEARCASMLVWGRLVQRLGSWRRRRTSALGASWIVSVSG